MKRVFSIATIFVMGLCFFSVVQAQDNVKNDLITYMNQGLLNIQSLEVEALKQYNSVIGDNYTTQESIYNVIKDKVVPLYDRFYNGLRKVSPETDELREIHQRYIKGAGYANEGFRIVLQGLETNNENIVTLGNQKLEKAWAEVAQWRKLFAELCTKYGVGMEVQEGEKGQKKD